MTIPKHLPPCAVNLLARPEWFANPGIVARANFADANAIARFLSSPRFAGRDDIWAITLGSTIHIRMPEAYDLHSAVGLALIAHELKHVEQYEREGLFNFMRKYLQSYRVQGGYSSTVAFETEGYEFQKFVEQHLANEFWAIRVLRVARKLQNRTRPIDRLSKKFRQYFGSRGK